MSCPICGEAGACPECRDPYLRGLGEARPDFRAVFAGMWRGGATPPPAGPDPITVFVDLCEFRQTCQCNASLTCTLGTLPGVVNRDQCRACAAAEIGRRAG